MASRKFFYLSIFMLCTLLLFCVACGGEDDGEPAAEGGFCVFSVECADGLTCVANKCLLSGADGDSPTLPDDYNNNGNATDGDNGGEEKPDEDGAESESDGDTDAIDTDVVETEEEPAESESEEDEYGLKWVSIPGGSFRMGCVTYEDANCNSTEKPQHDVNVPAFEITSTEITQEQYSSVIGSNPSLFQPPDYAACPDCPVEQVNWVQADAFCRAVGGRVPSEAEWEYAARAGGGTIWICGNDWRCLEDVAWYSSVFVSDAEHRTHSVAKKEANDFGLYDMSGNVREIVEDCWHAYYNGAPDDGSAWDRLNCSYGVVRGGAWANYDEKGLRVSDRQMIDRDFDETLAGAGTQGFRCARDVE